MRCTAIYYDVGNQCVDAKEFIVDSRMELEEKSREYAKVLVEEGWEVAGWNYSRIKEDI